MKTDKNNLKFSKVMLRGAFIYNPVLTQAIGICTIVAIGATAKISLIFSLILSALLIIMETLSSLALKKLSRWLRIAIYMLISTLLILPISLFMDKNYSELSAAMGIFLPLLAVNSIIVIRCEIFAVNNNIRNSFFDAVAASVGFTVVSLIVGIIREILAYGSVFGKTVTGLPHLSGIALPFGGLLVIGFLAAFHKWIILKKFPRYSTNTFNLRTAFDTPVLIDEGINATDGSFSLMRDPGHTQEDGGDTEAVGGSSEVKTISASKLLIADADDDGEDLFGENSENTKADEKEEEEEKKEDTPKEENENDAEAKMSVDSSDEEETDKADASSDEEETKEGEK
ncbi:MAG: Rnf-Nqr domain containing protein [Acutalibacteraceae bacterium]